MLDIKIIRSNKEEIEKKLQTKIPDISLDSLIDTDNKERKLQHEVESLKSKRNAISKEIGLKKSKNESTNELMNEVAQIGADISQKDAELKELEKTKTNLLESLPNIPMEDIPVSLDPNDNKCIKTFKEKRKFNFEFKNHLELNEKLKLFDLPNATKIAGNRWPMYVGAGARLEWALLNYMIDIHTKNGFEFILPPILTRPEIMYGSGQLPKFADQLFKIKDDDYNLYLIPTSEVALNGINHNTIIPENELSKKYVSYTPCFRREAGAAGKNERGLIRMHQFNKIELFCVTKPEDSQNVFETMIKGAEEVLEGLDLHYRNMLLVTGDMSFASAKTVDIEVWLPGQDRYYEVSSVSNCTDYQARRSSTRFKEKNSKPQFVHTLNGSGVATSRLMVAILENNQNEDGSVTIPEVLHKYLPENMRTIFPNE